MKTLRFLLLFGFLFIGSISVAQTQQATKDTVPLSAQEKIKREVDSMVNLTRDQFYSNNYDIAIAAGERTLKIARKINDTVSIFAVSSLIGNAFLNIEDTLNAKRIFSEATKEAEKLKDTSSIITARIDLGNYYALQKKREEAIKIYTETLPLAEKKQDPIHLFILNFNIAEQYLNLENLEKAEIHVDQTNKNINNTTASAYVAVANLNNGKLQLLKGDPKSAIVYLKKSIEVTEQISFTDPLIEGYENYAKAEAALGNFSNAYQHIIKVDELKSEKFKTDKIEAIESVTARFKLNQYEQELKAKTLQNEVNKATTKRETTIYWVKIASAILLVFSIFLFISYLKRRKLVVDLIEKNKQYLKQKEKSEELSKAKSILFSNITHELRTPMYGIIGISSILKKDKEANNFEENLNSLKFSANYLLSLVNNVLQLTKIDSTREEDLRKSKFNIDSLVKNVVESSKFINTNNPNDYHVSIDERIPKQLKGDDVKLAQILINLVGNSSKFTENGNISIAVNRLDDQDEKICLDFTITDNGLGISEEKRKHLFNEFTQTGISDDYRGAGLGLPIVKKILDLYRSRLRIESEVGKGTKVNFSICYEEYENIFTNEELREEVDANTLAGSTILVVDDNKINQIVTKKVLQMYGATVVVAGNGADSIEIAKNDDIDLILMDIHMPEMNGFEATERIRAFNSEIPILALTAVELEKVTEVNSSILMNDFIIKPYQNEVFIATVARHLRAAEKLETK